MCPAYDALKCFQNWYSKPSPEALPRLLVCLPSYSPEGRGGWPPVHPHRSPARYCFRAQTVGGALRHISIKKTSFLRNWTVFKSSWLCLLWLHSLHAQSPSHVQVFWLHGLYSPPGSCPWYFPGKNRGAGCLFFSRGSSQHKDRTHMSCVYCTGWWILYH